MNKRYKIITAILGVVFLLSAAYIINYYVRLAQANNAHAQMREEARQEEVVLEGEVAEEPEPEVEEPFVSRIDFAALQQENEHIYAWLEVPGTVIDYPVLQHPTDLDYYLDRTVQGAQGLPGSIYTQYFNATDFEDFNTIIYGHNMRNGTMFGGLHQYSDAAFLEENPYVYIFLPDRDLKYQIFAVGEWNDYHVLDYYGFFKTDGDKEAFLADVEKIRRNDDLEVTTDSNLITLATCIGNQPERRWLVIAVLIEE